MPPPEQAEQRYERSERRTSISGNHAFRFDCERYRLTRGAEIGFTLAEILITLGIIGVVASLTIPQIIGRYKQKVLHTQFTKSVSVFKNAINLTMEEYGTENIETLSNEEFNTHFLPILLKKLNIVNSFANTKYNIPAYNKKIGNKNLWNYTKTTGANTCFGTDSPNITVYSYALNDGQYFCFRYLAGWEYVQFAIDIDTNGIKGPNRYGYDIFEFKLSNSLQPYTLHNGGYCTNSSTHQSNGRHCAYYALKNVNRDDPAKTYWDNLKF